MKELSPEDINPEDAEFVIDVVSSICQKVGPAAVVGVVEAFIANERDDLFVVQFYAERISLLAEELTEGAA